MFNLLDYLKKLYISLSKKIGFIILIKDQRKSIHSEKLKKYDTNTGIYYLPKYAYQDVIKKEIIKNRIFDEKIYHLSKKFIKKNSSVIDAGANYGQMSILFSKINPDVLVYSFEASEYIYNILKKNIQLNSNNIISFNFALSDQNGEEYLSDPDLSRSGTYGALDLEIQNSKNENKNKIKFIKLDDISFEKKISFMKIDVQGWDLKVLKGAVQIIKKNRMPIIFEYEHIFEKKMKYSFEDFVKFFGELDYKFETVVDNNFLVLPKEY